jgi:hypothetical protein
VIPSAPHGQTTISRIFRFSCRLRIPSLLTAPEVPKETLADPVDGGFSAGPAAIAGYPEIAVPMGFVSGPPARVSDRDRLPLWSADYFASLIHRIEVV